MIFVPAQSIHPLAITSKIAVPLSYFPLAEKQ